MHQRSTVSSMSRDDVEYIKQADGALLATPRRVSRDGGAVRVRPNAQISESASAPIPEGKSKKQRVASMSRRNGRLSGGTIPEIMLAWILKTESATSIRRLATGWRKEEMLCCLNIFHILTTCIFGNHTGNPSDPRLIFALKNGFVPFVMYRDALQASDS